MTDSNPIVYLHSHSTSSPSENVCTDEKCPAFNIDQIIKEKFETYREEEKERDEDFPDAYEPFCDLAENIKKFAVMLAKEVGDEFSGAKDHVTRDTKNAAKDLAKELKNAAHEVKNTMKQHQHERSKRAKRASRFHPHFPFPPPPPPVPPVPPVNGAGIPPIPPVPRFTEAEIADLIDQGAQVVIHESDDGKSRKIIISY
ncbi:hypothetical protein HDV01_001625 [Terramyces sp. JEL0728]|nr:hypothetical protein HDV01_001625 [Terramyces sp. JEL0728]